MSFFKESTAIVTALLLKENQSIELSIDLSSQCSCCLNISNDIQETRLKIFSVFGLFRTTWVDFISKVNASLCGVIIYVYM